MSQSVSTTDVIGHLRTTAPLKAGYVRKRPVDARLFVGQKWRWRWLVLHPQVLAWYKDRSATMPKGYLLLSTVRVHVVRSQIKVLSASGRYLLFWPSLDEDCHQPTARSERLELLLSWLEPIQTAIRRLHARMAVPPALPESAPSWALSEPLYDRSSGRRLEERSKPFWARESSPSRSDMSVGDSGAGVAADYEMQPHLPAVTAAADAAEAQLPEGFSSDEPPPPKVWLDDAQPPMTSDNDASSPQPSSPAVVAHQPPDATDGVVHAGTDWLVTAHVNAPAEADYSSDDSDWRNWPDLPPQTAGLDSSDDSDFEHQAHWQPSQTGFVACVRSSDDEDTEDELMNTASKRRASPTEYFM